MYLKQRWPAFRIKMVMGECVYFVRNFLVWSYLKTLSHQKPKTENFLFDS